MPETSPEQKAPSGPDNASEKMQRFKGVRMRKWGKWVSEVRVPNSRTRIWLGSYHTPQQAARAYDCAVYCLRGSKAKLNFPDCPPEIPSAPSLSRGEIQAVAARYATGNFWQTSQDVAFSGSESRPCIEGQVTVAEQDPAVLDSFQQYLKIHKSRRFFSAGHAVRGV